MTELEAVEIYKSTYLKNLKAPTLKELSDAGLSERQIRKLGGLEELRLKAKIAFPKEFEGILDKDFFTRKNFDRIKGELANYNKFVITTAINGCKIDKNFLDAIDSYCQKNSTALIILPSNDPAHNLDNSYSWNFDPLVAERHFVFSDLRLNSNLFISTIKLGAKQIDPITGLARIGQRNGSFIYASPKQRLKYVAVGNNKLPHALMTTGAITIPDYTTVKFMGSRTAYIADEDHVMGAIVVEIENNSLFHFRQIQADKDGSFIDLSKKYKADGSVETCTPEAIILGDLHAGETDFQAVKCFTNLIKEVKPNKLVIHDAFSGMSVNPHEVGKSITQAKSQIGLEAELDILTEDLNYFSGLAKEIVIVKSNHDEFLDRYLESGMYVNHKHNLRISLELSLAMLDGHNPIQFAAERNNLKNKEKFHWLKRDEDYKIAGVQLAAHGDKGCAGSKGSLKQSELAYQNCIVGHSHSAEILRDSWCVGTLTKLKLNYNVGPSSWTHTSCILYKNGSRQLINCINGKFRL